MKIVQTLNPAQEILRQLGGRRFLIMTGIKIYFTSENQTKLTLQLTRNKSKAKFLEIKLESNDTYTLVFLKFAKNDVVEVAKFSNVYNNELAEIFTQVTGLNTSL